jgi:putative ABC transport system ATP-binding protein
MLRSCVDRHPAGVGPGSRPHVIPGADESRVVIRSTYAATTPVPDAHSAPHVDDGDMTNTTLIPTAATEPSPARHHPDDGARTAQYVAHVRNAVKRYGAGDTAVTALDDVTVGFPSGTFTAIMGPSGSGKSTLLHVAAGLDTLTAGEVLLAGANLSELSDTALTRLRRDRLGFIFQSFNLIPTLTAHENIALPTRLAGRRVDTNWVGALVDMVGLTERINHRPNELSGGQQQRVAVARALATRPELVFADEPTGNLDSRSGTEILEFLRRAVREMGQTVVMVTHDPVAASFADHVLFLADGRIVDQLDDPDPRRVLDRMQQFGA